MVLPMRLTHLDLWFEHRNTASSIGHHHSVRDKAESENGPSLRRIPEWGCAKSSPKFEEPVIFSFFRFGRWIFVERFFRLSDAEILRL